MKYKVGDKVRYRGKLWKVDMGYTKNNEKLYFLSNEEMVYGKVNEEKLELVKEEETEIRIDKPTLISQSIKIVYTHEDTILHLNELNTIKTRQIEDLMKFIAHKMPLEYDINVDFDLLLNGGVDYESIRKKLSEDIKDIQLVDGIMYHVRKGK